MVIQILYESAIVAFMNKAIDLFICREKHLFRD